MKNMLTRQNNTEKNNGHLECNFNQRNKLKLPLINLFIYEYACLWIHPQTAI